MSEILRLALLAPNIVEAAVAGKLSATVSLESLLGATLPRDWGEQRDVVVGMGCHYLEAARPTLKLGQDKKLLRQ